jgi:acid stress-induced BolA-like protein IbaG/YrbA
MFESPASAMITEDVIRQRLVKGLNASDIDVVVEGDGCVGGARLHITVVSNVFVGKPMIQRHRMVNNLFLDEINSNKIHSVTIKAYTSDQFEAKK